MYKSLRQYNQTNANLGYVVDDLRIRQHVQQKLIMTTRAKIRTNEIYIRTFKNAVYWVVEGINDYEDLKRKVQKHLFTYVKD